MAVITILTVAAFSVSGLWNTSGLRGEAVAATTNPTTGSPGYTILTFHLTGALTGGTMTSIVKFTMPFPAELLTVEAVCRAKTGSPTINVLVAGTSMISSVITMSTAGIVYPGTISTSTIADEAAITIDLATGTSVTDTTIIMVLKRQ